MPHPVVDIGSDLSIVPITSVVPIQPCPKRHADWFGRFCRALFCVASYQGTATPVPNPTRSSAIAEGTRDAPCQLNRVKCRTDVRRIAFDKSCRHTTLADHATVSVEVNCLLFVAGAGFTSCSPNPCHHGTRCVLPPSGTGDPYCK